MPYFPDEVAESRLPLATRVQRAKRRRKHRIAGAVVLAVALVLAVASWAEAHTIDVAAQPVCANAKVYVDVTVNSQRGDYRFAGTATDSEGHSVAVTLPAGGASTTERLGPVSSAGSVRVVGDFYKANGDKAEHMDRSVRYRLLDDCAPPPPPPPPVKQGSAGVSTTCDSVTFNFGGADEGVEQYAKVDGTTKRPASRNGSVTFKGLAPGEHPVEYGSGSNVQRGSFEALGCTPNQPSKDEVGTGTATSQGRTTTEDTPEGGTPTITTRPPGPLPFTGDHDRLLLAVSLSFFAAGLALLLVTRRREAQLDVAVRAVDRALRNKRYRGDRERLLP